jgi:hypothetical protein
MSYATAAVYASHQQIHTIYEVSKNISVQTQRELVVSIRNPLAIEALREMNPRKLKVHVERAFEHSGNEILANIKIVSTNQLKSRDSMIKTAISSEVEAFRQFADNWLSGLGTRPQCGCRRVMFSHRAFAPA